KTATVTVNPLPIVTVNASTVCNGTSATLTASGATTYLWNTGATAAGITVTPASTTNYTVTGITTGCSIAKTTTVTVNPLPAVSNSPLSQTICSGASSALVTLTSGISGTTFVWTASATTGVSGFTASGTSTLPVQTITTSGTTAGTVTYTITSTANGCAGTA